MPSWITVSPSSGSGNASVTVTAAENTDTISRSGTITVTSASGLSVPVSISQNGASYSSISFSPTSFMSGTTFYATVTSSSGSMDITTYIDYELLAGEQMIFNIGNSSVALSSMRKIVNVEAGENIVCSVTYSNEGAQSVMFPCNIYVNDIVLTLNRTVSY